MDTKNMYFILHYSNDIADCFMTKQMFLLMIPKIYAHIKLKQNDLPNK